MKYKCQSCEWMTDSQDDLPQITRFIDRPEPGTVMPVDECPECACHVQDMEAEPNRAVSLVLELLQLFPNDNGGPLADTARGLLHKHGFLPANRGTSCPNGDCGQHVGDTCFPILGPGAKTYTIRIDEHVASELVVDANTAEEARELGEATYLALSGADKSAACVKVVERYTNVVPTLIICQAVRRVTE
jgi:hypothetical protein